MNEVNFKNFSEEEQQTWNTILKKHELQRDEQVHPIFLKGLELLEISNERIPDLEEVNKKLKALTGFQGIPVTGLEEGKSFFSLLAERKFPIGNFIRDPKDIEYTPAPDVIHDLYGHLPFLTDPGYAQFSENLGRVASQFKDDPKKLEQFETFYWFTIEFALINMPEGRRIFGAGIASSCGECNYSLSDIPEVLPFDIEKIRHNPYRIDQMQPRLYIINSPEQLYTSLEAFAAGVD